MVQDFFEIIKKHRFRTRYIIVHNAYACVDRLYKDYLAISNKERIKSLISINNQIHDRIFMCIII
jgi:hypothetical protein